MKSLRARTWLLGMIAVLLLFTYLIFWVLPPGGRPSKQSALNVHLDPGLAEKGLEVE